MAGGRMSRGEAATDIRRMVWHRTRQALHVLILMVPARCRGEESFHTLQFTLRSRLLAFFSRFCDHRCNTRGVWRERPQGCGMSELFGRLGACPLHG